MSVTPWQALAGYESAAAAWDGASRQLVVEFNANVPYSGPCSGCMYRWAKLASPALSRLVLLGKAWAKKGSGPVDDEEREATIAVLGAMRRLVAVQAGIDASHAVTCRYAPSSTVIHRCTPLHAVACLCMPLHAVAYRCIPSSTVTSRYATLHTECRPASTRCSAPPTSVPA